MINKNLFSRIMFILLACSMLVIMAYANNGEVVKEIKEETTPLSPPEGNTTFMGGTGWCVALPTASQIDLQTALDWACGSGDADCSQIQAGGPCFDPDTLLSHASYAFNSYYQQNGNNDVACNFGGTATLTNHDPSYDKCVYVASRPSSSASGKLGARIVTSTLLVFCSICWLLLR